MAVNVYLNFNGNCREAVTFYKQVFETEEPKILTFGDMPSDPSYILPEAAKNRIMHTRLNICGSLVMFSDIFPGMPYVEGNQFSLSILSDDVGRLKRYYDLLKEGGSVEMELQETHWSKCYGSLKDRFGIYWQINYGVDDPME